MKGLFIGVLGIVLVVSTTTGCARLQEHKGAAIGAGVGAVAGSAIGGDTEGAIIGALIGALAGYGINEYVLEDDREEIAYALEKSETGQSSVWTNPDTGNTYTITPTQTYTMSGDPCREFVLVREANGTEYETTETACRRADGRWEVVS